MRKVMVVSICFLAFGILINCSGGGSSSSDDNPDPNNDSPVAQIITPAEGDAFSAGDEILFEGSCSDSEDGELGDTSLAWSSDLDGRIGSDVTFALSTLSTGTHRITLTGTDSVGAAGVDTVLITIGGDNEPHAHFDTERAKPGVVFSRSYRTQAEIDNDWYIYARSIDPCGVPCDISARSGAGFYSSDIDGAVLPYYENKASGQLRQPEDAFKTPAGTDVYVQYEIYMDSPIYSGQMAWDNDKKFRVVAEGVSDSSDRLMTQQWVGWDDDAAWFAFSSAGISDIKTGHKLAADTWQRLTFRFGFANEIFEAWVTDLASGITTELASVAAPGFTGAERIYGVWPMASSSDRDEESTDNDPDILIGFRNIIVSTSPIAE